jgi:hypothetical protein
MTPTNLPVDSIKPDGQPNQDTQLRPVSQLSLKDTFLNHLLIKDIDKDGSIDIVLQERGEVEGIGNEAFLTWLKWNGTTFHEYASTNIVHNLRQFLSEVKRLILEKEWRKLLTYAFRLEDLYRYKQQNYSDSAIIFEALDFDHFFRQEDLATLTVINNIQDIIFPEILENPFIVQEEQGYSFNLSYRIESLNGTSHIGEIILYMVPNPFNKKQFYFVLP